MRRTAIKMRMSRKTRNPKINSAGKLKSMFDKTFVKNKAFNQCVLIVLIFALGAGFACNYAPLETKKPAQTIEDEVPPFMRDLETMRTANFDYIYVFRRKDGGAFDAEDRKYLRANAPPETNRFVSTDEGKAFIAGSSYKFSPENLENLAKRFNVEDFSAKKEEANRETK